jgi:tRNA acetyltransferase TAN1
MDSAAGGEQPSSLAAMIQAEAAALRTQKGNRQRFVSLKSDLRGIIVVCVLDQAIDILALVRHIFAQIVQRRESKSRFLVRLSPLQHTCYSDLEAVTEMATPVVTEAFSKLTAEDVHARWAVHLHRRSTGLPRNETLVAIAGLVTDKHTVDLKDPEVVVLIDTCKCVAGLSVLTDFRSTGYNDFNIRTLQEKVCDPASTATSDGAD